MKIRSAYSKILHWLGLRPAEKIIRLYPSQEDIGASPILYFSDALNDFLKIANIKKTSHQTIIQAYLDVIRLCYQKRITGDDVQEINELKKLIQAATRKTDLKD